MSYGYEYALRVTNDPTYYSAITTNNKELPYKITRNHLKKLISLIRTQELAIRTTNSGYVHTRMSRSNDVHISQFSFIPSPKSVPQSIYTSKI